MIEELIFSLQKRRLPGHGIKADFAKAFDMVNRDFLFDFLSAYGFATK